MKRMLWQLESTSYHYHMMNDLRILYAGSARRRVTLLLNVRSIRMEMDAPTIAEVVMVEDVAVAVIIIHMVIEDVALVIIIVHSELKKNVASRKHIKSLLKQWKMRILPVAMKVMLLLLHVQT